MLLFLIVLLSHAYVSGSASYLTSQPFKARLELAASWMDDCPIIVEIGGGSNPINKYVTGKRVIVIDPEIKRHDEGSVSHIRKNFENWDDAGELNGKKYAVLLMGLELKMQDGGWHKLFGLIDGSHKAVIEYSVTYKLAKQQVKDIKKNSPKQIIKECDFDFSEKDFSKYKEVFPYRKMICLQ